MSSTELELLTKIIYKLAKTKLGFPTSFLSTNRNFIDNEILGIKPNSLANILLNNVGDPFKNSDSWSLEVKDFEVKILKALGKHFGLNQENARGYVTSGSTEANEASFRWAKKYLNNKLKDRIEDLKKDQKNIRIEIKKLEQINSVYLKNKYNPNNKQILDFKEEFTENSFRLNLLYKSLIDKNNYLNRIQTPTLVCSKGFTHYSTYKIAECMQLPVLEIESNENGSISVENFTNKIEEHLKNNPGNPLIINCNMGVTTTGAFDNIIQIKESLEAMRRKPVYSIHIDGAMYGLLLPLLDNFKHIDNFFKIANTISISFHKYLGLPQPCGVALTHKYFLDAAYMSDVKIIEYAGNIVDTTVSGSRSGFNVLLIYHALINALKLHDSKENLQKLVSSDLEKTKLFYSKLVNIFGDNKVKYNKEQFNILFPKPSKEIIRKYQLMVHNDYAIICVLNNVNTELMEEFINELTTSIKEQGYGRAETTSSRTTRL